MMLSIKACIRRTPFIKRTLHHSPRVSALDRFHCMQEILMTDDCPQTIKYLHDGSKKITSEETHLYVCVFALFSVFQLKSSVKSNTIVWFLLIVVIYETFSLTVYINYLTVHIFVLDISVVAILITQKALRGGLFNKQSSPSTGLLCGWIELRY